MVTHLDELQACLPETVWLYVYSHYICFQKNSAWFPYPLSHFFSSISLDCRGFVTLQICRQLQLVEQIINIFLG